MSKPATGSKPAVPEPKTHIVQKVIAGDTYLVMADSQMQLEDEFASLYYTVQTNTNQILQPPFEPKMLARLPNLNNILSQCIEAMEVNIDGTGHEFMPLDPDSKMDDTELKLAKDFFTEPLPNKSFLQIRRRLRRDLESIGYGFIEVLRTAEDEIAAIRNCEGTQMRFVKLDEAVLVEKILTRGGKEISMMMLERERRYVQKVGTKLVYYREFGSSRDLDRTTGKWAGEGEVLPVNVRATELIPFGVNPDVGTPYSVPRWINQLPSVLGSRKAEEHNLEFFDAGGMPPAIIFVQGGTLAGSTSDQLRGYLSGKAKHRQRAVVVEATSTSGSLEGGGGVQIKVERFGSEQANDSMYQKYDVVTEEHVRTGFRLPKLFLGRSDDYNYATAVVAYMVAEEQVFRPERTEFDETINKTLIKAMGFKTLKLVSRPITLKNVDSQLKALEMVKGLVKEEDYVQEVTAVGGVTLVYDQATADAARQAAKDALEAQKASKQPATQVPGQSANDATAKPAVIQAKKSEVLLLAKQYAQQHGMLAQKMELSEADAATINERLQNLEGEDLRLFNEMIAHWAFGSTDKTVVDLVECCH